MTTSLRDAFEELTQPAHPALASTIHGALAAGRPPRRRRPSLAPAAAVAVVLVVAVVFSSYLAGARGTSRPIPSQSAQPVTRLGPGAQVAWITTGSGLVAYNTSGGLVATVTSPSLTSSSAGIYGLWRSPDGEVVYAVDDSALHPFDAASGRALKPIARHPGAIAGDAFSPDGRQLALLLAEPAVYRLQVIDLASGTSQELTLPRDPGARTPGMSGGGAWAMPIFGRDVLYVLSDWGGPARLSEISVTGAGLKVTAAAIDGQAGKSVPTCDGPALAPRVVAPAGAPMLVSFCHASGLVSFIRLDQLTLAGVVDAKQPNPFALSPIFTPDGKRLYFETSGSTPTLAMIDLATQKLYGPALAPDQTGQSGPFAGLVTNAYAGGIATTVPISPDGLTLFYATADGILALRVPDLKLRARLSPGVSFDEVWVSGDGRYLFGTADQGRRLLVLRGDGGLVKSVSVPPGGFGFIASEHG